MANQGFQAATNGWRWVKSNLNNYINSDNIYPSYWWASADSVLGAALELAKTAPASTTFQSGASTFFNDGQFDGSGNWVKKSGSYVHQSGGEDAAIGWARYLQTLSPTDANRAAIITQLDNYYNAVSASIDTPFGTDSGNFNSGFGNNSAYSTKAYIYLNLYHALAEPRMLGAARDYMNWLYGANPFGASFIVGFGGVNVVPQYARPRPGSIGEILPGIVTTTGDSLTTWGGTDYAV